MPDREKVIRHIIAEISIAKTCKKDFASVDIDMLSDALSMLKEQEAVEPVKLVRCKNCKHCDSERIDKNMIWCKIHQFGRPDDYYCADGIEK